MFEGRVQKAMATNWIMGRGESLRWLENTGHTILHFLNFSGDGGLMLLVWRITILDKKRALNSKEQLLDYHLNPKFPDNNISSSESLMVIMLSLMCMSN